MLSNELKLRKVAAGAVTGTTEVLSSAIDMQGYEGVIIFATIATANAGNYLKAKQDVATGGAYADLAGSKVVAAADAEVVALDIYRPTERFVKGSIIRAGITSVTGDMYALQYGARTRAVANSVADTHLLKQLASPAEGTP